MAVAKRLKGQEAYITIIQDGTPLVRIDTIQSMEIEFEQTLMEEGYIGEVADRVDSVFNLMRVQVEGHTNSQAYLELADAIVKRSQNDAAGAVQINVVATFAFQNGETPSLAIQDVYFDSIPFNLGGRAEFQQFTLTGKASTYKIL